MKWSIQKLYFFSVCIAFTLFSATLLQSVITTDSKMIERIRNFQEKINNFSENKITVEEMGDSLFLTSWHIIQGSRDQTELINRLSFVLHMLFALYEQNEANLKKLAGYCRSLPLQSLSIPVQNDHASTYLFSCKMLSSFIYLLHITCVQSLQFCVNINMVKEEFSTHIQAKREQGADYKNLFRPGFFGTFFFSLYKVVWNQVHAKEMCSLDTIVQIPSSLESHLVTFFADLDKRLTHEAQFGE